MPELPEVETIKRGLQKNVVNKTIFDFDCNWLKMINYPLKNYKVKVKGLRIEKVQRRAKMLILDLSKGWNILIHLKMTGQLVYTSKIKCIVGGHPIEAGYECLPNKFTHATFTFTDGSHLFYNDVRKFGWVRLFDDNQLARQMEGMKLGVEPLSPEFSLKYLSQSLKKRPNSKIKQFLMDLKIVAGIGNIYSDEVCYFAKIKPTRLVKTLNQHEIDLIYKGIRTILTASIKAQGTTFSDYRSADGEAGAYADKLKVYGRYGEKCDVCKSEIKKTKIGGRTSSYCPKCQK